MIYNIRLDNYIVHHCSICITRGADYRGKVMHTIHNLQYTHASTIQIECHDSNLQSSWRNAPNSDSVQNVRYLMLYPFICGLCAAPHAAPGSWHHYDVHYNQIDIYFINQFDLPRSWVITNSSFSHAHHSKKKEEKKVESRENQLLIEHLHPETSCKYILTQTKQSV